MARLDQVNLFAFSAHVRALTFAHSMQYFLIQAINVDRILLFFLLWHLALEDAVLKFDAEGRSHAHTWHLFDLHAPFELLHHAGFQSINLVPSLGLQVSNELLSSRSQVNGSLQFVRVNLALTCLTHIEMGSCVAILIFVSQFSHKVCVTWPCHNMTFE